MNTFNKEADQLSPLALAFIGDGVYELYVRTMLLKDTVKAQRLAIATYDYVNHEAQSLIYDRWLLADLTEQERHILQRGYNAKVRPPKNGNAQAYHKATAVEALCGWLYLKGDKKRLHELLEETVYLGGK